MKKILIIALFLNFTASVFAIQNVFYDKITGKQILDVSGKKSKAQISQEFNILEKDLQELSISEGEGVSIVDGVMVKTDLVAEKLEIEKKNKADKETKQKPAIDKLKALGWTDIDIEALINR